MQKGLPFLSAVSCGSGLWEHLEQAQRVQNRLKSGKSKTIFEGVWCFLGVLRYLNRAKTNKFLNLGLERWANSGLSWLRSSVLLGACFRLFGGVFEGFPPGSPLT